LNSNNPPPATNWNCIAGSADGTRLIAVIAGGQIYLSSNSGETWTPAPAPIKSWDAVASSADGVKLAATIFPAGTIYVSTDAGTNWTATSAPIKSWQTIASSADGNRLFAGTADDYIYRSNSASSPSLKISRTPGDVALSWVVPSRSFVLQQKPDSITTNWTTVAEVPTITNMQNQVIVTPTNDSGLYRLKLQ